MLLLSSLTNLQHYWLSVGFWLGILIDSIITANKGKQYSDEIMDFNTQFLGRHAKTAYYKLHNEFQLTEKSILEYVNNAVRQL